MAWNLVNLIAAGPTNGSRWIRRLLDHLGFAVSFTCILHCVAAPLLFVLAPAVGIGLIEHESTLHWWLFSLAALIGVSAFAWTLSRTWDAAVFLLGGGGLASLYLGVAQLLCAELEVPLTLFGAALLSLAHLRNWHLRSCSGL